jgi:hypothetical protein
MIAKGIENPKTVRKERTMRNDGRRLCLFLWKKVHGPLLLDDQSPKGA